VHFFFLLFLFYRGERKVCPVPPGLAFVVDEWPFFSKVVNKKREERFFHPCSQKCQPPPKKTFLEETTPLLLSRFLLTPSSVFVA
jgi:hypothetical protein